MKNSSQNYSEDRTNEPIDYNFSREFLNNCPRYTSYPPINLWGSYNQNECFSLPEDTKSEEEISFYVHFPFCRSLCYYCGCHRFITKSQDAYSSYMSLLNAELNLYKTQLKNVKEINDVHFGGGTPSLISVEELKVFIQNLRELSNTNSIKELSIEIDPRSCTEEKLQALIDLNFTRFSFGIQDFDVKVQKEIGRIQSFEQIQKLVKVLQNNDISAYNFDLILGLPLQTKNSIEESLKKCIELKPQRIAGYNYAHLPNKIPNQRLIDESLIPDAAERWNNQQHFKRILQEFDYHEIGMDHYSLTTDPLYQASTNSSLHRNFMGYTTHVSYPLIGLGLSAISDTKNRYWQNYKDLKSYQIALKKKSIPIAKTHTLTKEESLTKQRILNVLCRFELKESDVNSSQIKILEKFIDKKILSKKGSVYCVNKNAKEILRYLASMLDPAFQRSHDNNYSEPI